MGSIIGPIEKEEGYDPNFSAAANIATAPTGLLIPPSNVMITFSLVSGGTSVAALFMAGYLPGILWGLACMIVIYFFAKKHGYRSKTSFTFKEAIHTILQATRRCCSLSLSSAASSAVCSPQPKVPLWPLYTACCFPCLAINPSN